LEVRRGDTGEKERLLEVWLGRDSGVNGRDRLGYGYHDPR